MVRALLRALFGGGRNAVAETVEVFRENAEAGAVRRAEYSKAALDQFADEFQFARRGGFDRFMDGLNRLPRPLMVLATFALFASAMHVPLWFAERMVGLAAVPDPVWWLAGTIVAFYFGGRFQTKSHAAQAAVLRSAALAPQVVSTLEGLEGLRAGAEPEEEAAVPEENPALDAWRGEAAEEGLKP